jgi:hypothetical protein
MGLYAITGFVPARDLDLKPGGKDNPLKQSSRRGSESVRGKAPLSKGLSCTRPIKPFSLVVDIHLGRRMASVKEIGE